MLTLTICLGLALTASIHAVEKTEECSAGDGHQVFQDWTKLWVESPSSFKVAFAKDVLLKLVEKHPEAKALFQGVGIEDTKSGVFDAHALRIFNYFDLLVSLLDNRDSLLASSKHLGNQHAARPGVTGEHFRTFGKILVEHMEHFIDDFHYIAWKSCFKTLIKGVVEAVPQ